MILLYIWIMLFGFVGTQLAWTLRPFFGDPRPALRAVPRHQRHVLQRHPEHAGQSAQLTHAVAKLTPTTLAS